MNFDDRFKEFRVEQRFEEIRKFVCVCSQGLSLPLYLAFWGADLIYAPSHKWEFLAIRSAMIPSCLLINFLMVRAKTLRAAETIGSFYTFANSSLIAVMMARTEGFVSPYYAGLNLVTIGISTFIPWTNRFQALNLSLIYLPLVVLAALHPDQLLQPTGLVNVFFMAATVIITMVIRYYSESVRAKELTSRIKLEEEVSSRQKIIDLKSAEAVRLNQLTRQFSPQVLHAIETGSLDISKPVHETEICAIFIDIVNSTERMQQLKAQQIHELLNQFMEDTMPVLLKYDITIDKFLGDGVLAFSNDPIQHTDYVERTITAAFEIKSRIGERATMYNDRWEKEFEVKVGIAMGRANVGFYGHETYVRSYTAIGSVMNLAARLSSVADANQVMVSEEVMKALRKSGAAVDMGLQASKCGPITLKGFDRETTAVYVIEQVNIERSATDSSIPVCPRGHGILFIDNDIKGLFVFRCRSCGYELEDGASKKAA